MHNGGNFAYDPSIYGLSLAYWVQVVGTGAATTGSGVSTKIRLNADRIASMVCYRYADVEFSVNVPVAPTAADTRFIGLGLPSGGNRGRIGFSFGTDGILLAVVYDNQGALLASKAITWDATWSAAETRFRIVWYKGGVRFFIQLGSLTTAPVCVFKTQFGGSNDNVIVPSLPLVLDINNANSDNMDVGVIVLKDISSWN